MTTQLAADSQVVQDLLKGTREPRVVDVPELNYLMVDGQGDPDGGAFAEAIQALYSLSYGAHFALKRQGIETRVLPLEALWGSSPADLEAPRSQWRWTAMIIQPEAVTAAVVEDVRATALKQHPTQAVREARLESWAEGLSAQVLHVGPYSAEGPTIARLHSFIADQGYRPRGRHHEVYLGDPRRSAPERLRTLVRQPVAPV